MATIELTGAEEVAWDLSDLYDAPDDPRIEQQMAEAEEAAAAFRDRYYGQVAGLDAAGLAEAIVERERIDDIVDAPLHYAQLHYTTNMADPVRERARPRAPGARRGARDAAPLLRSRDGGAGRRAAEALLADPALDHWRHYLEALRRYRPYLLSEPEEKIFTEKSISGGARLVAALRRADRRNADRRSTATS